MTWILVGAVFAVLNFNIPFGPGAIGILPDFLGYILIIFGMLSMERQVDYLSGHFKKSIRFAAVLVLMGVVDYVRVLTGWNMGGLEILILWGTAQAFLIFSCWQGIIFGIAEIQKREEAELKAKALLKAMSIMVLVKALHIVMLTFGGLIIQVCVVIEVIVGLSFIIQIFYTKRRYDRFYKERTGV